MTVQRLRKLLHYDAETGVFTWRIRLCHRVPAGTVAGSLYKNGRRYIAIDGTRYFAHRLAWLYVHGVWPEDQIDHINLDRDDNRIANLREATGQQNIANRRAMNALGVKGVAAVMPKKPTTPVRYRARIRVSDRLIHLGYFPTAEEANAAYAVAARKHFGEFARSA